MRTIAALALVLAGCTVGFTGPQLPIIADPKNAAELIIAGPERFVSGLVSYVIVGDGLETCMLANGEHAMIPIPAGERLVGVKYRDGNTLTLEQRVQTLNAEPGQRYDFHLRETGSGPTLTAYHRIKKRCSRLLDRCPKINGHRHHRPPPFVPRRRFGYLKTSQPAS